MNKPHPLIFVLILTLLPMAVTQAQQSELAGRVVATAGEVVAIDVNGNSRQLARRAEVFTGDTITTSAGGMVQLRMIDAALVSLSCNAALQIEAYSYEEDVSVDRATLHLHSGILRTITGAIGEQDTKAYQLHVGETRVEILGTDFQVERNNDDTLYFATFDGATRIVNASGSLGLGVGNDGDFAVVEPGQAPVLTRIFPGRVNGLSMLNAEQILTPDC